MQSAFDNAVEPITGYALGFRLQPLTLGHLFVLHRIGSPFVRGGDPVAVDLTNAVFVCCQDWRKSERDIKAWWINFFSFLWGLACRKKDFNAEAQRFVDYLSGSIKAPKTKMVQGQKMSELATPPHIRLLARAMHVLHISKDAAMDMPVAELTILVMAIDEQNDRVNMVTPDDESFFAECERLDALEKN